MQSPGKCPVIRMALPIYIMNGTYAGKTLQEYIDAEGKEVLGTHCRRFRDFPILTKFIDAKDNLLIQIHPDNRYALKNEGQYEKTEMWYVMDAGENAFLYYGFKKEISKEEFAKRIQEDTLLEVLNAVPVQKGMYCLSNPEPFMLLARIFLLRRFSRIPM